ncbi:ParB/RepB/Spo0J family partition protein [Actinomyces capricornis]|uniref:Chromosome partitioning protein ParB n=1 Tax=Actinomyces capricornis TaxID=2755559 RepID=A0ABN6K6Q5_9ACTO|nr:ParB/RepB/Spo0J family partition protein [Actinomyces capricornis]BDA64302.1 chromosome partitioning protein ParB [Actinomyces capricornis]
MAQKRRGLGRGLEALIPDSQKETVSARRPSDVFFPDSRSRDTDGAVSTAPDQEVRAGQEEGSSRPTKEDRPSGNDLSTLLTPPKRARGARSRKAATESTASSSATASSRRGGAKKTSVSRGTRTTAQKAPASAEEKAPQAASQRIEADTPTVQDPVPSPGPRHSSTAPVREPQPVEAGEDPASQESAPVVEPSEGEDALESHALDAAVAGEVSRETASENIEDSGPAQEEALVPVPGASFAELPVELIHPNPRQPRQVFDEDDIAELAASIKEVGLLQPIVVRLAPDATADEPSYELIMGERRLRASKEAGMETIPAVVRDTDDVDLLRDALLENLHRVQLNPLEEAAAYQQLLEDFHCTHAELSERIARSRSQISNTLRLMKLPPLVQRRLAAGVLSAGHARALLGLSNAAVMERMAQRIVAEGLSVRATEELVALQDEPEGGMPSKTLRARSTPLPALSTRLSDTFDTRVKVTRGAKKGRITIEFAGEEDLARIVDALAPGTSLEEE